ncbi:MAG: hypothetical protein WAM82_30090 [Thermoanaerobaculia bacterium]
MTHTTEFILKQMHANYGGLWLIAGGILWLGVVVYRASMRPDAAELERRMGDLKDSAVQCVRRFEAMALAYEESRVPGADLDKVRQARAKYFMAIAHIIREALATVPKEAREGYRDALSRVVATYETSRESFPVTEFSGDLDVGPMAPIRIALQSPS